MSKKEIMSAIERTIEETREYERQNPDDITTIMAMNKHRRTLEANLDFYGLNNPSPLRAIATCIGVPIGFVLSPVILASGLIYFGGKRVYKIIRNHYKK